MAGEQHASITIQATLSHNNSQRGFVTQALTFTLASQTLRFQRGGSPGQFIVPDPHESNVGEQYALQTVQNVLALLRPAMFARGLLYEVSEPQQVGTVADPNEAGTMIPVIEFTITATDYGSDRLPGFSFEVTDATGQTGWKVTRQRDNISPVFAKVDVTDATLFGRADGAMTVLASGGSNSFYFYTWADGPTVASRQQVPAGTYTCTVWDGGGQASTTVTAVVKSDPRLDVQVNTTVDSISLAVSGGVPPYAYAWVDGSRGPERTSLVAGTYACVVSDSHGAIQRVEVTLSDYAFYWGRNAITLALDAGAAYRADPTTKPNLSFLCQVWLEADYLSGTFVQVGPTLEQPADVDGRTLFEVQALLTPFLEYHVPEVGSAAVVRAQPLFRRFYLRHAEQYGLVPTPTPSLALERNYVVLGGLNFYEARQGTWFTSYQAAQLPFLTWEPATKAVLADQPEYLYYMVLGAPANFRLQVRVGFSDATTQSLEYAGWDGVLNYEVYCLPVGYQALALAGLNTAARQVAWWEVRVTTPGGGTRLSETRRFSLNARVFPHRRYFLFATSLGGMATYAALGQAQTDAEVTGEESTRVLPPGYDVLAGDTAVLSRALRPLVKVASGVRTQAQLVASQDLLLSRRVLLLAGARWVPGFLKAKTVTLLDEGKLVQTQEFEFTQPTERLYTPSL